MTLELNDNQVSLIRTALDTRLQRIDGMLNMFRNDGHKETDPLVVAYLQETQEVKEMYRALTVAEELKNIDRTIRWDRTVIK
jgi:hypothetical protein